MERITRENSISVTGFAWDPPNCGWKERQVIVLKSDLEIAGFIQKPAQKDTIKIKVSQGIVSEVEGIPEGYQYEVIECDKYGEPLPPEDDQ